jgi:hypothetical protein
MAQIEDSEENLDEEPEVSNELGELNQYIKENKGL